MCKADREVRPIFFNKTHYLHCTYHGKKKRKYSVDNGFIHSHDTMRIKTHGGKYHGKKKQT